MDIAYRPARSDDLDTAARIVQQAYNDIRVCHGLAPTVPLRPPLFPAFCLAEDPDGLWVAEAGGTILGFGFGWMRQRFWFLAQLFIRPDMQAKGVGQALLKDPATGGADGRREPGARHNGLQHDLHRALHPQRHVST